MKLFHFFYLQQGGVIYNRLLAGLRKYFCLDIHEKNTEYRSWSNLDIWSDFQRSFTPFLYVFECIQCIGCTGPSCVCLRFVQYLILSCFTERQVPHTVVKHPTTR